MKNKNKTVIEKQVHFEYDIYVQKKKKKKKENQ